MKPDTRNTVAFFIIAIILLYQFPAIGMWLPQVLYR